MRTSTARRQLATTRGERGRGQRRPRRLRRCHVRRLRHRRQRQWRRAHLPRATRWQGRACLRFGRHHCLLGICGARAQRPPPCRVIADEVVAVRAAEQCAPDMRKERAEPCDETSAGGDQREVRGRCTGGQRSGGAVRRWIWMGRSGDVGRARAHRRLPKKACEPGSGWADRATSGGHGLIAACLKRHASPARRGGAVPCMCMCSMCGRGTMHAHVLDVGARYRRRAARLDGAMRRRARRTQHAASCEWPRESPTPPHAPHMPGGCLEEGLATCAAARVRACEHMGCSSACECPHPRPRPR